MFSLNFDKPCGSVFAGAPLDLEGGAPLLLAAAALTQSFVIAAFFKFFVAPAGMLIAETLRSPNLITNSD